MSSQPILPEADDILAAELAFGLLEPDEQASAEARLSGDPAFAAAHGRWQACAAAFADGPGEAPPPSVWTAIESRLPANDLAHVPTGRLRKWQMLAGVAAAAAVVLGVFAVRPASVPPAPKVIHELVAPPLVAVLTDPKRDAVVTVSIDRRAQTLAVAPARLDPAAGDAELWVIAGDGVPRALGVIDARRRGTLRLRLALANIATAGATLAVSLEPHGGSPTGLPTGPVILTGKIAQS